ncbi:MAG: DUF559 domain-containing protein [Prevotella sp.]|nr:DUF559 domain-containing protein [Prevotella sp.]
MVYKSAKANSQSSKYERKILRNNSTFFEAILWKVLKAKQVNGLKFRRQHSIGRYILDFYCPSIKLGIELDGNSHYTQSGLDNDEKRTAFLNDNGISIMRFENKIVTNNPGHIVECILEYEKSFQQKYDK